MLNNEIKKKIDILKSYLSEINPHLVFSTSEIMANKEKTRAIERLFQLVVDEAIDINSLIILETNSESPENYRSTFYSLVDQKILSYEFADKISRSAKVRNQIVHDYEKMEGKVLIEEIKKFLPIYEEYLVILVKKFVKL